MKLRQALPENGSTLDYAAQARLSLGSWRPLLDIVALFPRWMENSGKKLRMNAQVCKRCCQFGTLMQAELKDIIVRHGPESSLIDKRDRRRIVECYALTFYLAARSYGGQLTTLLRDLALITAFEKLPRVRTAWN